MSKSNLMILAGLRVVELATYVAAPAAATALADYGAEVIKVERPPAGDPYRYLYKVAPMPVCEANYNLIVDDRNKKSVFLNLTSDAGREAFLKLIATADILITNYQPAILEKLRIRHEDLEPANPRLIFAHLTGYGEHGPDVDRPGFDMTAYWARSGLMSSVHDAAADPSLSTCGMGDHPTAMAFVSTILLGIIHRQQTGKGTKVHTSLLANGVWSNACLTQAAICGGVPYAKQERAAALNPGVNHYVSRDGKRFVLCGIQHEDWARLCRVIEREDLLAGAHYATPALREAHSRDLVAIADAAFAARDFGHWSAQFAIHALAWGPVQTPEDAASDPQMAANGVYGEMDHPDHGRIRIINTPLNVDGAPKATPTPPPKAGQDTYAVLRELGYAGGDIAKVSTMEK